MPKIKAARVGQAGAEPQHGGQSIQRNTQQLRAVFATFEAENRPLAPAEVLQLSSKSVPGMGLTTVYRLIKKLLQDGKLVRVELPNQASRYEAAGKGHHHHFLCTHCDRTFELRACRADYKNLAPKGFVVQTHDVFLQGRCEQCAR